MVQFWQDIQGGNNMRITTQMLAHSAAKSGIPFQQTTLLDILNKSHLFPVCWTEWMPVRMQRRSQRKRIIRSWKIFRGTWTDMLLVLWQQIRTPFMTGQRKAAVQRILFPRQKNGRELQRNVKTAQGNRGYFKWVYRQQLKDIPAGDKEALKSIGITQAKDGSLSIDEKVLQSADADTLKKVLDGDTGLASKISFVSGRISQNAASNVVSTSSQYTSNGSSLLSALETSKYDFWG